MFHQLVTPVAGNLAASFLTASVPIAVVLVLLGIVRRPAWQASIAGTVVAFVLAVTVWQMPAGLAINSIAAGATFAAWPVMWIVLNALLLYNISVVSGRFDAFRAWMVQHLPNDRRVVLVVIGFSFGCLLEGVAGFGAPIAITSALLVALGFKAIDAVVFTLMFNTAPVAFGALGAPVTTLGAVTQLHDVTLGAMIGRQLPFIALALPFYVIAVYGGARAIRGVWPVLLVAGGSFAFVQFLSSNYLGYALTDVLSSLSSLILTLIFVKVWKVAPDPEYALRPAGVAPAPSIAGGRTLPGWQGWLPWLVLSLTVIVWVHLKINTIGELKVQWPGLHNQIFITTYNQPYAAIWSFQPLATGSAILVATLITSLLVRVTPAQFLTAIRETLRQVRLPLATTMIIVGLAYLMNYSGIAYTLGVGIASVGIFFPLVSAFLGWLAVFLSGSDTSGNALFGNLQVVAANQLQLSPVLMAATNASGGVLGKMISPQNISTGTSTTDLKGQEGAILARTFKHSIFLTLVLGIIVMLQQFVFPWVIPR
ncbi:L-lactate permease [Sphingomonas sp. AP4-R1]|uniref:L-lactate permease n=1 Tax=Sphingomonas sp. AP4-R1 TaxID=2735134 RepID=UPI001493B5B9|nr:L-lactate permease [Sphingomonas sp. AP4-R1]QJU58367.1 L-lactate permease [Sphingomonas sp. AP4-R1]